MNPSEADEHARTKGIEALDATRRTMDEIERAIERSDWRTAGMLFSLVGTQANVGVVWCRRLAVVKAECN